jgi:hypothetical protein
LYDNVQKAKEELIREYGPTSPSTGTLPRPITRRLGGPTLYTNVVVTDSTFGADPYCSKDATAAFQSAIDVCYQQGCGTVFAPSGCYRFDGTLLVHDGVALQGDWQPPGSTTSASGTVLAAVLAESTGLGLEGTPFLSLCASASVQYLTIRYESQQLQSSGNKGVVVYPPTISAARQLECSAGRLAGILIRKVTLLNSYVGIRSAGRDGTVTQYFHVTEVYGTPLKTGIVRVSLSVTPLLPIGFE